MKIVIIEDEKAAVRNLTSLLNEIKPNGDVYKRQSTPCAPVFVTNGVPSS